MDMTFAPPPPEPINYESPTPGTNSPKFDWAAITSLVCGIVSVLGWCVPLCGCPVTIGGIVFGIIGLKSEKRTLAIWGIALSVLFLIASIINAAWGAYLGATGQHPFIKP